jgi:GNAT superfamily N-acetyltransferase
VEWYKADILLTDDVGRVDADVTFRLLAGTYWGIRRPRPVVTEMIKYSLCFTMLHDGKQIGFGRAVTDQTVFSWIADIVIDPVYRGRGLGKWMVSCIADHPLIRNTQMVLQTREAQELYKKFGFSQNPALMSTPADSPGIFKYGNKKRPEKLNPRSARTKGNRT